MTTLIKIIRKSIKRNPHAFSTTSYIPLRPETTFKYEGFGKPEWLDNKGVYIGEIKAERIIPAKGKCSKKGYFIIEGHIIDEGLSEKLYRECTEKKHPGLNINVEIKTQEVHHISEPEYFYKHKNSLVECSECYAKVRANDIRKDENMVDICPKCGGYDTFDYKYEKLGDILKTEILI